MSETEANSFTIAAEDFDLALLPTDARVPGSTRFREAVTEFLQREFQGFGGRVTILVDDKKIAVAWHADPKPPKPLEIALGKIRRGQVLQGIQIMELLLGREPDDVDLLYNLGIALSDAQRLDRSERHLRRAIEVAPDFVNALTALGVLLARQGNLNAAIKMLERAVVKDEANPWARRNLGGALMNAGRLADAVPHPKRAAQLQPDDQAGWLGLGDALRNLGERAEAEAAYRRAVEINPTTDLAEKARRGNSQLAEATFREKLPNVPRQDAVHYCAGAIEMFSKMPKAEIQKIAFEVAMLGREGFDVNTPDRKYRLKSMEGTFTGLQLVCLMYVGFQIISPGADVGFNLSNEYRLAKEMIGRG